MAETLPAVPAQVGTGTLELAKALAAAQAAVKGVEHDKRNQFHKYDYTSAEAIIAAAKDALTAAGLSLIPIAQSLNGYEREGENRFELQRQFLLLHPSGERFPIAVNWPVCPEKGRPLDKAVAAAATTSLAYLLRDLLLMPRVDPSDDIAAREDRPPPAGPAKPTPDPKGPAGKALVERLLTLCEQKGVRFRDRTAPYLSPHDGVEKLTREQAIEIGKQLKALPDAPPRPPLPPTSEDLRREPKTAAELTRWLAAFEAKLVAEKSCEAGELLDYVNQIGEQDGLPDTLAKWPPAAISAAVECVRDWVAQQRAAAKGGAS